MCWVAKDLGHLRIQHEVVPGASIGEARRVSAGLCLSFVD